MAVQKNPSIITVILTITVFISGFLATITHLFTLRTVFCFFKAICFTRTILVTRTNFDALRRLGRQRRWCEQNLILQIPNHNQ